MQWLNAVSFLMRARFTPRVGVLPNLKLTLIIARRPARPSAPAWTRIGLRVGTAWSGLGAGLASGSLDALRLRLTSVPLAVSPIRAGGIFTGGSLMEPESESARGDLRLLPNLAFVAGRTVTPSRRIMP